MKSVRLSVVVLMGLMTSAFAGEGDIKKLAATPPPELDALKYFVGNWACEGKFTPPKELGGKEYSNKGTASYTLSMDGFWVAGQSKSEKPKDSPMPDAPAMVSESRLSFDRSEKAYVHIGINNRGGYSMSKSKGWEGDKLVWESTGSGLIKMEGRTVISKKSDREYIMVMERKDGAGWLKTGETTCKKQ